MILLSVCNECTPCVSSKERTPDYVFVPESWYKNLKSKSKVTENLLCWKII